MVWWGASLRYETGEKKLNEVDLISQRVEMISSVPTTVTKAGVEFNLRIEDGDFGVSVVRLQTCLTDILGFLEKFRGWFEQDIDDEGEDEEGDGEV
ncbi:hypothetical protein Tco_1086734 [Tanacetum coccineum]